ncbi:MAG: MSHA biogenesis protein MshI [Betaproteobacteria bacterium]|nr:MAG: MSHA biogenesis protein MshI [Betaproteobacteria bacterium]
MSQQINLYSPLFRKQKKLLSAMLLLQATGLLVLAVAGFYFYLSAQTSRLEARVADSSRQLQNELEQLKVHGTQQSPDARVKLLAERRKKLEAEFSERTQALQAMDKGAAGRTEGYSGLLRALARLSMDGIWLTRVRFSEERGEAFIAGRAARPELVPLYLQRLRTEERLQGQDFSSLEITRPAQPARFIEFVLSSGGGEAKK